MNDLVKITWLLSDRKGPCPRFSGAKFSELSIKKAVNYKTFHKCHDVLVSFSVGFCLPENWSSVVFLISPRDPHL